jgi:hypothetical protein
MNRENICMIRQPKDLKINLYKHQLSSVYQMESRENYDNIIKDDSIITTNIGVNGDSTGYGKTLSMVSLILRDKMEWDMETSYIQSLSTSYAGGLITKTIHKEYEKLNVTLVLAGPSIINQWEQEFKHAPTLRVITISTKKNIESIIINNYDVVIVVPTMYNFLVQKYLDMSWKRFIYDEPGHLKILNMRFIVAKFYWFVTATPDMILYNHKKCKGLMNTIFSQFSNFYLDLNYIMIKNKDEFILESYIMPKTNHYYYKCYNPTFKAVEGLVSPKIIEMISAGNIYGAIKALGGKETENIVELVKQKKIQELEQIEAQINVYKIKKALHSMNIWVEKANRVKIQIQELSKRYGEIMNGDCSICTEKITKPVMEPNCQNIFCGDCMFSWLKNKMTCPLCRNIVNVSLLTYIKNGDEKDLNNQEREEEKLKTKENIVIDLILNNAQEGGEIKKFLIFSAWDETFEPIRNILSNNNINFIEIKGSLTTRTTQINEYKTGKVNTIFLNTKNNGSGINLQSTTDIIIFHDMNESTITQIIGRANRIGRVDPLNVHYLQI